MITLESILDNGGETAGRYTLTFLDTESGEMFMYGADENPFHPQGFGMFVGDGGFPDTDEFPEVGRAIDWHELPDPVKRLVNSIERPA